MLHLLYILAFTILALIAISNLIRNLMMFSGEQDQNHLTGQSPMVGGNFPYLSSSLQQAPHPELLDTAGNLIKDPLLVMRSLNVEDVRVQLDALYDASPSNKGETKEEG